MGRTGLGSRKRQREGDTVMGFEDMGERHTLVIAHQGTVRREGVRAAISKLEAVLHTLHATTSQLLQTCSGALV